MDDDKKSSPIDETCIGSWMRRPTQQQRGVCFGILLVSANREIIPSEASSGTISVFIQRMSGDQQTNTNSRTSGAVESTKGDTQRNMIEEIQSRWKNQTQQNQSSHQQPPLQPNPKTDKNEGLVERGIGSGLRIADYVSDIFQPNSKAREEIWQRSRAMTQKQLDSMQRITTSVFSRQTIDRARKIAMGTGGHVRRIWEWMTRQQ
eukprot:gene8104-764_t